MWPRNFVGNDCFKCESFNHSPLWQHLSIHKDLIVLIDLGLTIRLLNFAELENAFLKISSRAIKEHRIFSILNEGKLFVNII